MAVIRSHERATKQAPADRFTGQVWQDEVLVGVAPSRMRATNVSFAPGARTAWHSHPVGQTLYVVSGVGRLQLEGEPVRELRPGDTGLIPPNTRHWHGAAPGRIFVHLAMSENADDGAGTDWYELVSDVDYEAVPQE